MNMNAGLGNSIACPACQQSFAAHVEQIVDVSRDPSAKNRLLSGQINVQQCPSCGYQFGVGTPLVYHDPAKELLLTYVPVELGLPQPEQERLIGTMVKAVMDSVPNEQRKGYLFQPRPVLSMQGLIEAVLGADGVTPEMIEAQREKMRLVELFIQASEDQMAALVTEHDAEIDEEFFMLLTVSAQNAAQSGRSDVAQQIMQVRDHLLELSTAGKEAVKQAARQEQAVDEVLKTLQDMGDQASLDDFLELVISYAGDDERLQAVVGLQFPLFDYNFFQMLTTRIDQAAGEEKTRLSGLRDRLLELTEVIKQQQEATMQAAAELLRQMLRSEDLDAAVKQYLPYIDETFLMVLSANIQAAEQNKDINASAKLKALYEKIMAQINQNVPAELRFITELLRQESLDEAKAMVDGQAAAFGPALLQYMDVLLDDLQSRDDPQTLEQLKILRDYTARVPGMAT